MAKVLVVEDNADNMALVRFLLERAGFEVVEAGDGRQGIQMANDEQPDLILLDMALPEVDGWSAVKELKKTSATKAIPVVALTACTLPVDRDRALSAGCDGFMAKPMNVASFIEEITAFLPKKTAG